MRKSVIVLIVLLFFLFAICFWLVPRKAHLNATRGIYHYLFFDKKEMIQKESVLLSDTDLKMIESIINPQWFFWGLDYPSGYSDDHCIVFKYKGGKQTSIMIWYGSPGKISLNGRNYTCELDGKEYEEIYRVLSKYHMHERVLLGG